jgi:hypothetical protein
MLVLAGCAALISVSFALLSFYKYRQPQTAATQSPVPTSTATATPSPTVRPSVTVTTSPLPTPTPTPQPQSRLETIVNNSIDLRPGQFRPYRFIIKADYRNTRITGRITASGGGQDDIVMMIVDDEGLQDFTEDGRGTSYYRTKIKGSQNIDLRLASGVYHIIFSNAHSHFFSKQVRASIYLEFD